MEHRHLLAPSGSKDWREKRRRMGRSADDHRPYLPLRLISACADSSGAETITSITD
jgi:hypothetical protein